MILCFTGTGETRRIGNTTLSDMWVRRARTLRATTIIDNAVNVAQAQQRISQLTGTFNEIYFIGHASTSAFYFFATLFQGRVTGSQGASLNLTQLTMPTDPSYQRSYGFLQALARILPPTGGKVIFESCLLGTNLNLRNTQNVLASLGKRCILKGYPVLINWRMNGQRVVINQGARQAITLLSP